MFASKVDHLNYSHSNKCKQVILSLYNLFSLGRNSEGGNFQNLILESTMSNFGIQVRVKIIAFGTFEGLLCK